MIKLVFFDFTRTLSSKSVLQSGLEYLGHGKVYDDIMNEYRQKKINREERVTRIFAGWKEVPLDALPEIYEELKDGFYEAALDCLEFLTGKGIKYVLCSNMPTHLGEFFKKEFLFYRCIGTELEVIDGKFTGKILRPVYEKGIEVKRIMDEEGLTPEECVMIGDSEEDVGAWNVVGRDRSIGFNAPKHLEQYLYVNMSHWKEAPTITESISNKA